MYLALEAKHKQKTTVRYIAHKTPDMQTKKRCVLEISYWNHKVSTV